ncbi:MAG: hypothetical protein KKF12_00805 [Proteobacteria bacterium]|nr:hypothetical protein [Pseudomonadota bacterium]
MKQTLQLFFLGLVLSAVLGCNTYTTSSGPVIETAPESAANNRIVTFTVIGKGVEPEAALTKGQARLMAERAAVADGYRQFVEKIKGVYVQAYSKGGYGAIDKDSLTTSTQAILRGVEIQEITHGEYGIAQAVMQLRINFTRHGMIWWPQGLANNLKNYETASLPRESN